MTLRTALQVFVDGAAHRVALYRALNVSTTDTVDVSADFKKVTAAHVAQAAADNPAPCSAIAEGAVITVTAEGLVDDAVYLLVIGSAAQ